MLLWRAMLYERLGEVHSLRGFEVAEAHYAESFHLFRRCLAQGKAQQLLEEKLSGYFVKSASFTQTTSMTTTTTNTNTLELGSSKGYDLETVLRATQAISNEIKLPALLKQLIKIVHENAGAQRSLLALYDEDDKQWKMQAVLDEVHNEVLASIPIDDLALPAHYRFSSEVFHYVRRKRKSILLDDAAREENPFQNSAYIKQNTVKSLLCAPLVHQGRLIGIIYQDEKFHNVSASNRACAMGSTFSRMAIQTSSAARKTASLVLRN